MKLFWSIFLFIIVLIPFTGEAQVSFTNSKLLILVEEPNKKIEEKLDPNELIEYRKEIETYNANLKKCIEQYWKLTVKPEFVSKAQMDKAVESKAPNTLCLLNSKYSFNYADYASYKLSNKLFAAKDAVVENYNKKQLPYRACMLEIKRADLPLTGSSLATAAMPSIKQMEEELVYAIKSIVLQIDYRNKGTSEVQLMKMYIKNAPHLKELTLLINENDLDGTVKQDIKTHYKLAVQLSDKQTVKNAILNSDKTKAIVLSFPNADGSFTFKVFDASTMEILGQTGTIPPTEYYPELNNKIKAQHLADFTHYCD